MKMTLRLFIKLTVYISAVILAGVLIGLGLYGIDLSNVFLGTPWSSPLPHGRGEEAIVGAIVFVTLVFGGLFVGGVLALLFDNIKNGATPQTPSEAKQ